MEGSMDLALYSAPSRLPDIDILPGATALLVIDMQFLDAHPDWGIGKKAKQLGTEVQLEYYFDRLRVLTLPALVALLSAFRGVGLPVIHAHVEAKSRDGREVGWRHRSLGLIVPRGSREAEFLPEAQPLLGEVVLGKTTSGTFASTDLDLILRNMEISRLVVAGVTTNNCVESTVREAADRGYRVIMVEEATATFSRELQAAAIKNIDRNFGVVRRLESVLAEITALPPA
ncbi:MAG: cysteine hydrolase [Thermoleophilia bacterium]|nr:cysteine hydrolase [Thermoleophilia bacterium]